MRLSRRSLLNTFAAAPAALGQTQPSGARRPNILLVLSDDHSAPFLGAYGSDFLDTPNLDALATGGMLFSRAFTAAPQCVPSRAAIMSGRSPVAIRMGRFSSPMPPDVVTLPELLREGGGYYTGVCGRYFHLDGVTSSRLDPVSKKVYEKHNLRTWHRRVNFLDTSPQQQTAAIFSKFLDSVPQGRPFFFWMNYSDPHHVWDKNAGSVDPASIKVPPSLPDLPGTRDDLSRYCGEIERADGFFSETEKVLRSRGLADNTIVIFMGDNGMAFPHGKGSLYDPGLNVPLIVRWPGKVKTGSKTDALVSGEDIAPTLLEAAGLKPHKDMSGRSFLGLLTGDSGYRRRPVAFAARLHHGNAPVNEKTKANTWDLSRCARSERFKLIYNVTPFMEYAPVDSAGGPGWQAMLAANQDGTLGAPFKRSYFGKRPIFELYDLENDPGELENLAGRPELSEVQRELTAALQQKMILDYDFVQPPIAL